MLLLEHEEAVIKLEDDDWKLIRMLKTLPMIKLKKG